MHIPQTWKFFAFAAVLVVSWRLYGLHTVVEQTPPAESSVAVDSSGALFKELLAHKLLTLTPEGVFRLPDPDKALAEEQEKGKPPAYAATLKKLYEKAQGKELQKQIHLWNLGHQFAAVRDNRTDTGDANRWKVSDGKTKRMLNSVALLPAEFIYVGGETLRGGFHDWRTSRNDQGNPLMFTTEINNQEKYPLTWNVQIIGTVDQEALTKSLSAYQPQLKPRRPTDVCDDVPIQAWELVLSIPPQHNASIEIPVGMAYSDVPRLDGVAICMTKPGAVLPPGVSDECLAKPLGEDKTDNAVSNEIASEDEDGTVTVATAEQQAVTTPRKCRRPTLAQHKLHWQAQRLYVRGRSNSTGENAAYTVYTLDTQEQGRPPEGKALISASPSIPTTDKQCQQANLTGRPTLDAETLGLLPLIGQDRHDRYALSGILNASRLEGETTVHLTLNSKMQAIAQQHLKTAVATQKNKGATGAVVLLNPQTGAILAAAHTSPQPLPGNTHSWDRNAFSQIYPTQDPTQFSPWQGATGFNAPASTFKLVTALAGLAAIRDGHQNSATLEKMMAGVERNAFKQITGLDPAADVFTHSDLPRDKEGKSQAIKNDHPGLLSGAFSKYSKECGSANKVGVCEALRDSANNWFMQLVFNMDYMNYSAKAGQVQYLADTAKQLGFQGSSYLAPENLKLSWIKPRNGGRGDVLNAFGGHMSIQVALPDKPDKPPLGQLLFNSIGQDMAASPLQLAKLSASIATGKNLQPHLFAVWNGRDLYAEGAYPEAETLDFPHLDWVQAGMKAVVNDGTAKKFGGFAPFVYGKTGTAQATPKGEPKQRIAWFTGFYTPEQSKPEAATLAFACQITRSNSGGGAVCAPMIRNVLEALQQANLLETSHAK